MNLRRFFERDREDAEQRMELESYVELTTAEYIARGMEADAARTAALKILGNTTLIREEIYRMNTIPVAETVWRDIRYACRTLRRNLGFTVIAAATLAIGIASNAAIFSFVDAVLLKPLPYVHADRIVRLQEKRPDGASTWISTLDYLDWKNSNTVFDEMAVQQDGLTTLTVSGEPVSLRVARVSAHYFDVFGVRAFLGRTFRADEDQPGKQYVAVLSHALWEREFGSDIQIVGKTVLLDKAPYTVIGVMPSDSAFDRGAAEIWYPLAFQPSNMTRYYRWLSGSFATLRVGVSIQEARSEMDAIGARIAKDYPDSNRDWGVSVESYGKSIVGPQLRTSLLALMAAVGGLLLICCSNLANLALARGVSRWRELAVRASLGASRSRLIQQSLIENIVLAISGGLLGIGLSYWGMLWVMALVPAGSLPREANVQLDLRVLLFALSISILTGIAFGIVPSVQGSNLSLAGAMKAGGRSSTSGSSRRLRDVLVVGEVAIAFILLCGSGLLIRSFFGLLRVDTGFDSTNVLTMSLPIPGFPPGSNYSNTEEFNAYIRALRASVDAVPGVRQSAITNALPLTDCCLYTLNMRIENHPAPDPANRGDGYFKVVTPSYFSVLGIHLRRGRFLTDEDTMNSRPVVVVNERLVKRYFGNENPIGQHILNPKIIAGKTERGAEISWEVVGVVADEKINALDDGTSAVLYAPYEQSPVYFANLLLRANRDPSTLEASVRKAVHDINPGQAIMNVRSLDSIKSASVATDRLRTVLLTVFSAIALILAAVGIYGLISYSVAQRTHEMGIRTALGASAVELLQLVLTHGLFLTATGLGIGFVGAFALTRLLGTILHNVDALDPYTIAVTAVILLCVALMACLVPALRATRVDPSLALRGE